MEAAIQQYQNFLYVHNKYHQTLGGVRTKDQKNFLVGIS
jgi:hypothetical protein